MALVTLNYWAGARAVAGVTSETVEAATIADALDEAAKLRRGGDFLRVVRASSFLVGGISVRSAELRRPLDGPTEVEVLPPFAGG